METKFGSLATVRKEVYRANNEIYVYLSVAYFSEEISVSFIININSIDLE